MYYTNLKASSDQCKPKVILYIEDEFIIAMAQQMILAGYGYAVVHASTGEKALAKIVNGDHFDLILSDIDLGAGIDGPEAVRQILKIKNIPTVFLTSHSEPEMVAKVEGITNYGYVIKNSGEFVLAQTIKGALRLFEAHRITLEKTEALQKSEARFHSMFLKHSAVMLLLASDTGNIMDANFAAERFYGYSIAALIKMNVSELNNLPVALVATERQRAVQEKRNYFIFPHKLASGDIRIVEVHSSPIYIEDKPLLFSVIHDITERSEALIKLGTSEALYKSVVNNSADLLVQTDATGVVLLISPSFEKVLGHSSEDILGKRMPDFIHSEDFARCQEKWKEVFEQGIPLKDYEYRILDSQGAVRWIAHSANLVVVQGEVVGVQNTIRNITEQKQSLVNAIK